MKKLLVILTFTFGSLFLCRAQITVLHNFGGADGENPASANVTLLGKTLFGMTENGGANNNGVIFSVDTNGNNYRVLYSFSSSINDGWHPWSSFTLSGHTLFGMTLQGGGVNDAGTIFSIDTSGNNYKIIYSFANNVDSGGGPYGDLTLIGKTLFGMTFLDGAYNGGVLFSIDTNGNNYKNLIDFSLATGDEPQGSLTPSVNGKVLYGMTYQGGAKDSGTIFSIDTGGSNFKILHNLGSTDGAYPLYNSMVLEGKMLYGMTNQGGSIDEGVIFSLDTNGTDYKVLVNFNSSVNGANPRGNLIRNGTQLLGMTPDDSIFSVDTNGSGFTALHGFDVTNGNSPWGALTFGGGKTYYGLTNIGGSNSDGVVFKFENTVTGINQIKTAANTLLVYPNPTNNLFTIQSPGLSGKSSIEVYNMLGEKVYATFSQEGNGTTQINLSGQANGLYLVKVISQDGTPVGESKVMLER
jgi:uncharacterized repeat protein (TIGR03803 family)